MMVEVDEPLLHKTDDYSERLSQDNTSINEENLEVVTMPMVIRNYRYMSKRRVLKNIFVLALALFWYFLGFMALSNLQSTLNSEKGLGVDSQAAIYAAAMFACLLLPDLMIKTIGCKKSLILAVSFSIPYVASNFYPCRETLIPSAVLLGLAAGPLTTSQAYYTNEMARRYNVETTTGNFEVIVSKFYGFNSFSSENTQIWGNLISYYALRPGTAPILNHTDINCGVNFRKDNWTASNSTNSNLHPPTDQQRNLLVSIYFCAGILAVLIIMFFVDPLENDIQREESTKSKCASIAARLCATLKQAVKLDQILLVPLPVYCGMQLAFYMGDFTEAFIACSWGVHHVGFVTICFGVCGALMAIFVGPLVKYVSQMSVIFLAALINITAYILLFVWHPSPDVPSLYFVFAGVWGMTDAIWWSQVPAVYGLMFPNDREAAFSNFYFWSFLGFFLSFSYANYLSVAVKIIIMLVFLVTGITLYIIGQIRIKCTSRSGYLLIDASE